MRIAVLIIGLLLGLVMFLQAFVGSILADVGEDEDLAAAAAGGLFVAILWLVGCAFVIAFPRFSAVVFVLAALIAFAVSGEFPDMAIWGSISLVLAVMSFFGWRGKRRDQVKQQVLLDAARAQLAMAQAAPSPATGPPPSGHGYCRACGAPNPTGARFCGSCGAPMAPGGAAP